MESGLFVIINQYIRAGLPVTPEETSLPLLPLGPDGVRRAPPHRTRPNAELRITDREVAVKCFNQYIAKLLCELPDRLVETTEVASNCTKLILQLTKSVIFT